MKRKGQSEAMTIIVVAIMVIFFVILAIILLGKVKEKSIEQDWKSSCKISVRANAAKQGILNFRTEEVICPTREEPVVIDWDVETDEGREKALREIADKMENCWDVYGQGKLDLFNKEKGRFCGICHIFSFEGKAKNKEIEGFYEFLINENVPGKDVTYFQYLQGYQTKEAAEALGDVNFFDLEEQTISTYAFDKYATVFFYVKGEEEVAAFNGYVSGTVTALLSPLGAMIPSVREGTQWVLTKTGILSEEEQQWASYIYFMPYRTDLLQALQCELPVAQKTR